MSTQQISRKVAKAKHKVQKDSVTTQILLKRQGSSEADAKYLPVWCDLLI